eukprot:15346990-Ditylum_brightwellii.AAC.1
MCDFKVDLWATVQRGRGACHPDHTHDGAVVSGVYYSSAPSGSAPLLLRRPSEGLLGNKVWDDKEEGAEQRELFERVDGEDIVFRPREGQLILFPPWLYHGVPSASHEETQSIVSSENELPRVSFAFNLTGAAFAWGDPGD